MPGEFSEALLDATAIQNLEACYFLDGISEKQEHSLYEEVRDIFTKENPYEIAYRLECEVTARRIACLRAETGCPRPQPYNHPTLASVHVDSDGLVCVSDFNCKLGGFRFGNSVFEMAPATNRRLSSYWTRNILTRIPPHLNPRVRLDPFMRFDGDIYRSYFAKMDVYARPLTWEDVLGLDEETHFRWMPDQPDESEIAFTDAVFTPRDGEIHLTCEECPTVNAASFRASRYFHTIISKRERAVIHCDGANRIYDNSEIESRLDVHVRQAGKIGSRVKLFAVDGRMEAELWMRLFGAFFVWNDDVNQFAENLK